MQITNSKIGITLKKAMKLKGVTQTWLASYMGVRQGAVSQWISNGRVSKDNLNKLIAYFSDVVTPEDWGSDFNKMIGLEYDERIVLDTILGLPKKARSKLFDDIKSSVNKTLELIDAGNIIGFNSRKMQQQDMFYQ